VVQTRAERVPSAELLPPPRHRLARRRVLGRKHGVEYAEAFHHIGGDAGRSAVEEYVKKNAVPVK